MSSEAFIKSPLPRPHVFPWVGVSLQSPCKPGAHVFWSVTEEAPSPELTSWKFGISETPSQGPVSAKTACRKPPPQILNPLPEMGRALKEPHSHS